MRHLPTIYLVIACIAVALFVAGLPVFAGEDADPLAGVFAFLVALPWILVLTLLGDVPLAVTIAVTLGGIVLNYLILRRLTRRWRVAHTGATQQ